MQANAMSARLARLDLIIASVLLVVVLVAGGVRMVPGVIGVYQDDGVYAITARALAQGDGYRLINLPGEPRQTKYPILFPLLLAIVWKIWPEFPANAVAMQWITLGAAAGATALGYVFLVAFRMASRPIAAVSAFLCALAPTFLYLSTLPMSEALFGLLVVMALWRAQSMLIAPSHPSRRQQLITGILIALPFLCRGFGVAILTGILVAFSRARRPVVWTLVGTTLVVAPWVWWALSGVVSNPADPTSYYTNYADSMAATFSAHGPRILGLNLLYILMGTVGAAFDGLRVLSGSAGASITVVFLVAGVMAWWRMALAAWRGHLLPMCLLMYCGLAVVWPWPPARFLLPVLPLLVACALTELSAIVPRRNARAENLARAVGTTIVAIGAIGQLGLLADVSAKSRRAGYPYEPALAGPAARGRAHMEPGSWRSYTELFAWVRANSAAGDVVACGLDTVMYLYTDRQSFRPVVYRPEARYGAPVSFLGSPTEVQSLLERGGARYLALVPGFSERQALADAVKAIQQHSPGWFELVYTGQDTRFVVFRIRAENRRQMAE
jgi:hypothetical protein